jgi:hypothetical protein
MPPLAGFAPAPSGWRHAGVALERAAEGGLGTIPDLGGNGGDPGIAVAERLCGEL